MCDLDLELRPTLAPHIRLQIDTVTGEPVLLYPEGVLVLNVTAHAIVSRANGIMTIGAILSALAAEYEAPAEELRADVMECLASLRARRIVLLEASRGGNGT